MSELSRREHWIYWLLLHGAEVRVEYFDGLCPVQAEGDINGHPFYFRARHGAWTLDVVAPGCDPIATWTLELEQHVHHVDGVDPHSGYGTEEEMWPYLSAGLIGAAVKTNPRMRRRLSPPPTQELREAWHRLMQAAQLWDQADEVQYDD